MLPVPPFERSYRFLRRLRAWGFRVCDLWPGDATAVRAMLADAYASWDVALAAWRSLVVMHAALGLPLGPYKAD